MCFVFVRRLRIGRTVERNCLRRHDVARARGRRWNVIHSEGMPDLVADDILAIFLFAREMRGREGEVLKIYVHVSGQRPTCRRRRKPVKGGAQSCDNVIVFVEAQRDVCFFLRGAGGHELQRVGARRVLPSGVFVVQDPENKLLQSRRDVAGEFYADLS